MTNNGGRRKITHWVLGIGSVAVLAVIALVALTASIRPQPRDGAKPESTEPGDTDAPTPSPQPSGETPSPPPNDPPAAVGATPESDPTYDSVVDAFCANVVEYTCDQVADRVCGSIVGAFTQACADAAVGCAKSSDGCSGGGTEGFWSTVVGSWFVASSMDVWSALPRTAASPDAPAARTPGARLGVAAIRAYQRWVSPRLSIRCRYLPTCSRYAVTAIERYGLLTGAQLAVARIRRCTHQVPQGTWDAVPIGLPV